MKKKIIFIVLVIIGIGIYIVKTHPTTEVIQSENLTFEINTEHSSTELVKSIKNGKIISQEFSLATTSLGEQEAIIKYTDTWNKEQNFKILYNIVDTTSPEITITSDVIETTVGTEVDLLQNATISDNSKEELEISIIGEYDFNTVGEYSLKYSGEDSSLNKVEKVFILKVNAKEETRNNTTTKNNSYNKVEEEKGEKISIGTTEKGYEIYTINGVYYIDGILIANKTYTLPSTFFPSNTYKSAEGVTNVCNTCINKTAYTAWLDMESDAAALGLNIWIQSGYRPYASQEKIYNSYVQKDGVEVADTYSSRPGHSDHQTGLAFDLNTISDAFGNTLEGKWVNDNCYKYGFIIRFPKNKQAYTGYNYESWHLRYVGVELATILYNNGDWISLEEYFGITSKYDS